MTTAARRAPPLQLQGERHLNTHWYAVRCLCGCNAAYEFSDRNLRSARQPDHLANAVAYYLWALHLDHHGVDFVRNAHWEAARW